MNVEMSDEAKEMHDRLIDALDTLPFINFNEKDGKNKNFHITIASKQIKKIFDRLYEFVNQRPCHFECLFDNVTIFKWGEYEKAYSLIICKLEFVGISTLVRFLHL